MASPEARIYAADDVIAKYVRAGAPLQINISAAMRARILRRNDLAAEDLFREARREALSIMQTVSYSGLVPAKAKSIVLEALIYCRWCPI